MRLALDGAGEVGAVGAAVMAPGVPTFAGGTGAAWFCPPDETHAERARDINRTGGRRIEILSVG
jgi:hypothetical protein